MKDSDILKNDVKTIIDDTIKDIEEYLNADVPLECYHKDIDAKLASLKKDILETISYYID